MQTLIVSRNLIGDGLMTSPALRRYQELHPDEELFLLTNGDHVLPIYSGMGIKWASIMTGEEEEMMEFDKRFTLGAGDAGNWANTSQRHIAEGFAHMLGVGLNLPIVETPYGNFPAVKPIYDPMEDLDYWNERNLPTPLFSDDIIVSPFSASCSSQERDKNGKLKGNPPNKMLPPEKWLPIFEFLSNIGNVVLTGSKADEDKVYEDKVYEKWYRYVAADSYFGTPIPEIAMLMRHAKLVVTVDNGMGHIASSQDAKHILLYPMCLGMSFIIPWGANKTIPIQMDPNLVTTDQLLYAIKKCARNLCR